MSAETVTLTVDGKEVTVPAGTLVIRAAEALGVEIPRFCEHPLLSPVGACRQCIVEIEGQRKPVTSCTTPVADGMVVRTQHTSEAAEKAQRGMLELLLINHPLDCPVCDRGGECPLQDQALAWGPGESRYVDPKRVFEKPVALSSLVLLDRERCVLCTRCTRFCDEISGERFIELFDRGAAEQVSIAPGEDFRSPFSGNTVQICPVGALTSSTYRFAARPFDVRSGDSVCPHCASGCNIRVDVRRGEVVRHLARDNYEVNDSWLCDKGRYAFRFPDRDRVTTAMLRVPGLEPVSFAEAFEAIATRARDGGRVAFIAGGRLTDEDAYALSKLARTVFRTNDLDHRPAPSAPDALAAESAAAAAGTPVTYRDVERARAIVVVGLDPREELPILHLRIRKAVRASGARVIVVGPRRTALGDVAEHVPCAPGREADVLAFLERPSGDTPAGRAGETLQEAGAGVVILAGPRLASSDGAIEAATRLAATLGGQFALLSRRAGDRGALRAGVHPALLPGGHLVTSAPGAIEEAWGDVPSDLGRPTARILEATASREIDVLYLVGVDPLTDFPDAGLVERAMANAPFLVVQDISIRGYEGYADAVLPAAAFLEREGHYTDWEGRGQRLRAVRPSLGLSRPDWQIFQELSEAMGADMGFRTIEDVQRELGELLTAEGAGASPQETLSQRAGGSREVSEGDATAPTTSAGPLTLFTYPLLVDDGRLSEGADELQATLGEEPFVELHPDDAGRLGLEDGATAHVRTDGGAAELPVRVSKGIEAGTAFVPWNQPGFRANALLSGTLVTRATVEAAGADRGGAGGLLARTGGSLGTPGEHPPDGREGAA